LEHISVAEAVRKQALKELADERFKAAVAAKKIELREKRSLWDRLVPFRITITRK
jgi:hypothetical protein